MKTPQKISYPTKRIHQDRIDEREAWHHIVVKIISWRDGLLEGGYVKETDKITSSEWRLYCDRILKTNLSGSEQKVIDNLKQIRKKIKDFGGFSNKSAKKSKTSAVLSKTI